MLLVLEIISIYRGQLRKGLHNILQTCMEHKAGEYELGYNELDYNIKSRELTSMVTDIL